MGEARRRRTLGTNEPGMQSDRPIVVKSPLVIMFENEDGGVTCHLHPSDRCPSHESYGLLVTDLVRHVARKFSVDEEDVWEWVDKERRHPTTGITNPS